MDPTPQGDELEGLDENSSSFLSDLTGSIPGIDEAMSFAEVMRQVLHSRFALYVTFQNCVELPNDTTLVMLFHPCMIGACSFNMPSCHLLVYSKSFSASIRSKWPSPIICLYLDSLKHLVLYLLAEQITPS